MNLFGRMVGFDSAKRHFLSHATTKNSRAFQPARPVGYFTNTHGTAIDCVTGREAPVKGVFADHLH
jgi:hypothetical protein